MAKRGRKPGFRLSPAVRAKMSAASKAALADPAVRAKMSAARKAALADPAVRAKRYPHLANLSEQQLADYKTLRKAGYRQAEALAIIAPKKRGSMIPRYSLGPALGGEPPYCFILDAMSSHPYGVVFGSNVVVAEDNAVALIARLNDPGEVVHVELIEPALSAEVIRPAFPRSRGVRR